MSSSKKVTLKSSDGETFEVEEIVAVESQTIKHMIEDDCADSVIPVPNVTGKILSKVIEYCKKHVYAERDKSSSSTAPVTTGAASATSTTTPDDALKAWDADFISVDQSTLFDLILVIFSFFFVCRFLVECPFFV